jgi:hypothetical protein
MIIELCIQEVLGQVQVTSSRSQRKGAFLVFGDAPIALKNSFFACSDGLPDICSENISVEYKTC